MTRYDFIEGTPQPQPRPRARIMPLGRGKYGRRDTKPKAGVYDPKIQWRRTVAAWLRSEPRELIPAPTPVFAALRFFLPHPKSHLGTGRNAGKVRPSKAGLFPVGARTGDVDNMAKAVLDEFNGVLFDDDSQVTRLVVEKYYAGDGQRTGLDFMVAVDRDALRITEERREVRKVTR